jgi:hypothetical protein
MGPQTLVFLRGAVLTLMYDRARLPANVPAVSLQLYAVTNGIWAQVRGSTVDTVTRRVTGNITRGGTYAVVGTPVDRLVISGPMTSGALVVGQSTQLQATAFDPLNTVLPNRLITWTSSNVAAARVDATGKVTAAGVGSATITASSEGKSANTTLTIIARPIADWSGAVDWATYQGNAGHTGYVPITADPVVFQELWVKQPFNTAALNPVTEGQGRVYVSTTSYFGAQQMGAFDARTGTTIWSRDFGAIHGVHPPAYAAGSVYVTSSGHEDSFLYGLDAATGTVRFRSAYGNQWSRYLAPVIIGDAVYMAGGYYGGVYSFTTSDGTQRWFVPTNQYDEWTPAVANGRVYTYTGEYAPKVTVHDATTGALLFEILDNDFDWSGWSMNPAPVLGSSNNLLATNGGRLISFNLENRTIGWQQKASFTGTVTVANGELYAVTNGQVDVRRELDGSLIAPWIPPEGRVQPPTIATRNLLFASTEANTYAIGITTRRQVWSYPAGGKLSLSSQGILFISQNNGKLAAINLK